MLVVYRHAVNGLKTAGQPVSSFMYGMQEIFHNFRMPVFFILSGIFLAGSLKRKSKAEVVKNRSATLLYPYLLWAVILSCIQIGFSNVTNSHRGWDHLLNIIVQPREVDHMWYLFALFNTSLFYVGMNFFFKRTELGHLILGLLLHFVSFYVQQYSLVSDVFYFYIFFSTGAYLSPIFLDKAKREKFLDVSRLKWLLPLFVIGQWFWFTHEDMNAYNALFLVINFVACYVVYLTAYSIAKSGKNEWLAYIGKHSLYIYILHVPFAAIARIAILHVYHGINIWLLLLFCWLFGIIAPIVLVSTFRRWGIERLFSLQTKTS